MAWVGASGSSWTISPAPSPTVVGTLGSWSWSWQNERREWLHLHTSVVTTTVSLPTVSFLTPWPLPPRLRPLDSVLTAHQFPTGQTSKCFDKHGWVRLWQHAWAPKHTCSHPLILDGILSLIHYPLHILEGHDLQWTRMILLMDNCLQSNCPPVFKIYSEQEWHLLMHHCLLESHPFCSGCIPNVCRHGEPFLVVLPFYTEQVVQK